MTCNNPFLETDGFCSWCGEIHKNPTKPEPDKLAEPFKQPKDRWTLSEEKCPKCSSRLHIHIIVQPVVGGIFDGEILEIIDRKICRTCDHEFL